MQTRRSAVVNERPLSGTAWTASGVWVASRAALPARPQGSPFTIGVGGASFRRVTVTRRLAGM